MPKQQYVCQYRKCSIKFTPKFSGRNSYCCPEHCRAEQHEGAIERAEARPKHPERIPIASYEEAYKIFSEEIGRTKEHYRGPKDKKTDKSIRDILVLSDLHSPFCRLDLLAGILKSIKADLCVLLGDTTDSYAFSPFLKHERVSFREEWAVTTTILEQVSETYPEVLVVEGNHDSARLEKRLRERLTQDQVDAVEYLTGGLLSPLQALAARLPNVKLAAHKVGDMTLRWLAAEGDALFLHAEKYSRVAASTLRAIDDYLADFHKILDLAPFKLVMQGHTHGLLLLPYRADKIFMEVGCLCKEMKYQFEPNLRGRPQRRACTTFRQIDGKTDINSIRIHFLDEL